MPVKSVFAFLLIAAVSPAQRSSPSRMPYTAGTPRESPALRDMPVRSGRGVELSALNEAEKSTLHKQSRRLISGVQRALPEGIAKAGAWEHVADGRPAWRVSIHSQGALGLRVHFSMFSVGKGKVWLYAGAGDENPQGPYSGRGLFDNGEFWSGTVFGERAVIEYQPADPLDTRVPFEVVAVSHRTADFARRAPAEKLVLTAAASDIPTAGTGFPAAAACNLDANCFAEWHDSMKMVADIFFEVVEDGQTYEAACTGSLVATSNNSLKPYFLTAGHCISSEAEARTMEALWTYQTSACGAPTPDPATSLKSQVGAHYLASATIQDGDYSLLLLNNVPDGVLFAGWDTSEISSGATVTGIHHPMGSWKRILFGHRAADTDVMVGTEDAAANLYYTVGLDQGIAQPGSSGSPLFEGPGVIVGTLSYGPSAPGTELCASPNFTVGYARFSVAYPNLKDYLEDLPFSAVTPATPNVSFSGTNGTIDGGISRIVPLTTPSATPIVFNVRSDAPWIQASVPTHSASASAPVPLTIAVNSNMLKSGGTFTGTVSVLAGAAPPQFINVQASMNMQVSSVEAAANPNPVTQADDGTWSYVLRLKESAGAATRVDLLKVDGVDYSDQIASWFGQARLDANGTLEAPLTTVVFSAPYQQYISIGGQDEGSGQRWFRTVVVTLNPGF